MPPREHSVFGKVNKAQETKVNIKDVCSMGSGAGFSGAATSQGERRYNFYSRGYWDDGRNITRYTDDNLESECSFVRAATPRCP